jgi:hypothetical protein
MGWNLAYRSCIKDLARAWRLFSPAGEASSKRTLQTASASDAALMVKPDPCPPSSCRYYPRNMFKCTSHKMIENQKEKKKKNQNKKTKARQVARCRTLKKKEKRYDLEAA